LYCRLQIKRYREVEIEKLQDFSNVDESNIRLWRRNKTNFENCDRRKRADRRGKPHWPELEVEINKMDFKRKGRWESCLDRELFTRRARKLVKVIETSLDRWISTRRFVPAPSSSSHRHRLSRSPPGAIVLFQSGLPRYP
ncbi:uncharacterized protein TNCV_1360951, partial [Trichonephila clavipes]